MAVRTYVAFVRAVMIGREGLHRPVLLELFERAGATAARSYISTGNVSFDVEPDHLDQVVGDVEIGLERLLGRPTPVFVRSLDCLRELVEREPFADAPHPDPRARLVTMTRHQVPDGFELPIVSPDGDYHVFAVDGGETFSITVDTGGRIRDPGGLIERTVDQPVTTRAWGTITRIVRHLDETG